FIIESMLFNLLTLNPKFISYSFSLHSYLTNINIHSFPTRRSSDLYLPKIDNEPQKFTYTRSLFPGLEISGWGISVGNHEKSDGTKSSSLHFGTPQKISPIREGRGYWQYIPKDNRVVTFLSSYNYETNFCRLGKLL